MKTSEIKDLLHNPDVVGRKKNGNYIARWGFFYTHGKTSEKFAAGVKANIPNAEIVDHGEVWKPFRGGATVSQGSHFYVEFKI